jgi:hypothetical protein
MKVYSFLLFIIYFLYINSDNLFDNRLFKKKLKKKREKKKLFPKSFNLTEKLNKNNNSFINNSNIYRKFNRNKIDLLKRTINITNNIYSLRKNETRRRKKFEKLISKFDYNDWINIEVNKGSREIIYQGIGENVKIIFAYIINDSKEKIRFLFKEPKNAEKKGYNLKINENYFYKKFKTNTKGIHKFIFDNKRNNKNLKISFALKYRFKKKNLTEIDRIGNNLNKINKYLNILRAKENLINKLTKNHIDVVNKHNKNIVIYGLIEIIVMIIILFIQLFYIKSLVKKF